MPSHQGLSAVKELCFLKKVRCVMSFFFIKNSYLSVAELWSGQGRFPFGGPSNSGWWRWLVKNYNYNYVILLHSAVSQNILFSVTDVTGHAHVLLAAFERVCISWDLFSAQECQLDWKLASIWSCFITLSKSLTKQVFMESVWDLWIPWSWKPWNHGILKLFNKKGLKEVM